MSCTVAGLIPAHVSTKMLNYQQFVFCIAGGVHVQTCWNASSSPQPVSVLELSEGDRIALTSSLLK